MGLLCEVYEWNIRDMTDHGDHFEQFTGLTFKSVSTDNIDYIRFITEDDTEYLMHHEQDCCEQVYIHEIVGDLKDLEGSEIVEAECSSKDVTNEEEMVDDMAKWTFYKLQTAKGIVTISWFGTSNGYYSMGVSTEKVS